MSVVTQRAGLKTRLATISGLRVMDGYDLASVPAAVVGDVTVDYGKTMSGASGPLHLFVWKVRVYVGKPSDRAAMSALDGYLDGASGIKAAIEGDKTLGGAAESLVVTGLDGYGVYEVGSQNYLGAEFSVTVSARGS